MVVYVVPVVILSRCISLLNFLIVCLHECYPRHNKSQWKGSSNSIPLKDSHSVKDGQTFFFIFKTFECSKRIRGMY